MLVIPAIDLRGGRVVRLLRGEFERETIYADDPLAVARRWVAQGAGMIHVVDLDGARRGQPIQLDLVRSVSAIAPVQAGGGLRSEDDVDTLAGLGVDRVVLNGAALEIDAIRRLTERYGERLVISLDTRAGLVASHGWTETTDWTLMELARLLIDAGVKRFLHTDVERDGALTSPNFESLETLIALGVPVVASGGVSTLRNLDRLRDLGAEAAIVGRALYEDRFSLEEALAHAG